MGWMSALLALAAFLGAIGLAAWRRPDQVYKRSGLAIIAAFGLPVPLAFALSPFLGEGAGLGAALLIYAVAGATAVTALAAVFGATVRHVMNQTGKFRL
jgi:hypothetical protein